MVKQNEIILQQWEWIKCCLLWFGRGLFLLHTFGLCCSCCFLWWIEFLPGFNPGNHGIPKLLKVRINRAKLFLDILWELNIAFLHGCALFWENDRLEEWNDLLLPVYALVFLLQINKWVACLAVPNVWQPCFHP